MSFIQFENASEKERDREQIHSARAELLKRAEEKAKIRDAREIKRKFRGDDQWMLPAVAERIDNMINDGGIRKERKDMKKRDQHRRRSKKSKKKRRRSSSNESNDSLNEERITKEERKEGKLHGDFDNASTLTADIVPRREVTNKSITEADDWMSGMILPTYSKIPNHAKPSEKKDSYNPSTSVLELNTNWKNSDTGLPAFKRPSDHNDDVDDVSRKAEIMQNCQSRQSNWQKKSESSLTRPQFKASSSSDSNMLRSPENVSNQPQIQSSRSEFLTDQQMNELGAKILKAEIMNNEQMVDKLRAKLECARQYRAKLQEEILASSVAGRNKSESTKNNPTDIEDEILLTSMNSKGMSRPVMKSGNDLWGGNNRRKTKKDKVDTHSAGERVAYFADDDKYDIKQMFEKEKFSTADVNDKEFAEIAGKYKSSHDDLEDLFTEHVGKAANDKNSDRKERSRAIQESQKLVRSLELCDKCFDSPKMEKQNIVAMGTNVYLSLPWHEVLQTGQCIISSLAHVACVTQLDEDVWHEMREFMKAITRMFAARKMDVIFFESARNLHRRPHLQVHCVPGNFEMAPFYFKKAIEEAEGEWTTNKKLINLSERDVRRTIPKGLSYFWVNFGMDSGFAHIIEDQNRFPNNFAQEVIGGLLNLDPKFWRRPRKVTNLIPKVKQFADWWKPYDITK